MLYQICVREYSSPFPGDLESVGFLHLRTLEAPNGQQALEEVESIVASANDTIQDVTIKRYAHPNWETLLSNRRI